MIHLGLVWVEAVIRNPNTGRHVTTKALVDAVATLTVVPRRLLRSKGTVELGERVSIVEAMGGKVYTHIPMLEDVVNMVLMGVATLEALGLEVDPVTGN